MSLFSLPGKVHANCPERQSRDIGSVNDIAENIIASIFLFAHETALHYSAKCPIHLPRVLS